MSMENFKEFNPETVSQLLSDLEKSKNNEDKVEAVDSTLACLEYFMESEPDSVLWEHLSESIGKICEACFCISVKLNTKELIGHNINVLEHIIEVNKNLTNHICGYLLDPFLTALFAYCDCSDFDLLLRLANLTCLLCQKTSRMKRSEIVPTIIGNLNSLSNLVFSCGDYEIQAAIMEIIARCNSSIPYLTCQGSNQTLNLFSCSEKFSKEFQKYSFVNFEGDCRLFLNALNESLGEKRQVYSIPCKCVVLDNNVLNKPKDPNYKSFWVDINLGRKRISFYHEPSEDGWTLNRVYFDEIVKVVSKNSICGTKNSHKKVETVKVEFNINCKDDDRLTVELLKIYSSHCIFKQFHRVLVDLFPDVYNCKVELNSISEIERSENETARFISSVQLNVVSDHEEHEKSPSKLNAFHLTSSEFDTCNITKTSEKHTTNKSNSFCLNKNNVEGLVLNYKVPQKALGISKSTSSNFESKSYRKLNKGRREPESDPVKLNDDSVNRKHNKSYLYNRSSSSESVMDEYLKNPNDSCNIKDSSVKRKRLYSIENSTVLSFQEESQPHDEIDKKKPRGNEKSDFVFSPEKGTHRNTANEKKPLSLFCDEQSSEESDKCVDSLKVSSSVISTNEESRPEVSGKVHAHDRAPESSWRSDKFCQEVFKNHSVYDTSKKYHAINTYSKKTNKRLRIKKLPSLSPCTSDSDYKPAFCKQTDPEYKPYSCKETVSIPGSKRVLRSKNQLANTRDSIEQMKSKKKKVLSNEIGHRIVEETKTQSSYKKPQHFGLLANISRTQTSSRLLNQDNLHSKTNKNTFLSKKGPKKGGSSFVDTIDSCKRVESIRNEVQCKDIKVNAVKPEEPYCLPRKITCDPGCRIIDKDFDAIDLDQSGDLKVTNLDDDNIANMSNVPFSLEKGNVLSTWNVVNEISVEIHNESLVQDGSLVQAPFKMEDILELSKKSELSLQNNIKACLIQSQQERASNFNNYDLQLQTSRSYILESCEKLQRNFTDLENMKVLLNENLNAQKDLIIKIQSEMSVLEKAKEELFIKESEVKNNEAFSIMKIFHGIGTYIRRILFTSSRQNASTTS